MQIREPGAFCKVSEFCFVQIRYPVPWGRRGTTARDSRQVSLLMEKCRLSFGSEFLFSSSRVQVSFHGCSRSVYSLSHTAGGRPALGADPSPSLPNVGTWDPYLPFAYLIQACQWLGFPVPMEAGELHCLNCETKYDFGS